MGVGPPVGMHGHVLGKEVKDGPQLRLNLSLLPDPVVTGQLGLERLPEKPSELIGVLFGGGEKKAIDGRAQQIRQGRLIENSGSFGPQTMPRNPIRRLWSRRPTMLGMRGIQRCSSLCTRQMRW